MNWRKILGIGALCLGTLLPINGSNAHHKPKLEESIKQVEKCDKRDEEVFDYYEFQNLCEQNNKLYSELADINDPEKKDIITGDIIKRSKEKFNFKGETLEYRVILFDENLKYKDIQEKIGYLALWNDVTKTVSIDNTGLTRAAENVYENGYKTSVYKDEFSSFMMNELYWAIKKNANSKEDFIKKFKKVVTKSTIKHEKMHHFYPYSGGNAESRKNEAETFLYQISKDKKYNSWVFLITTTNQRGDEYKRFYNILEERGYSKEELMKLKPKERSKIVKEIFEQGEF